MPKATLSYQFDLPEEQDSMDIVLKANHLDYVIDSLDNYLRGKIKYSSDLTDEQLSVYQEIRDKLHEFKH